MNRARVMFALCAGLGLAGVALAVSALLVATTRINLSTPAVSDFLAACGRWALPHGGPSAVLVLALGSFAVAVLARTLRTAWVQVRAGRQFQRQLPLLGRAPTATSAWLVEDAAPRAFCAGLLRPRIYLSTGALEMLSGAELEAVIAHEAHHARQRDPLRQLFARSLGHGLFFMPAVTRLAARYAELAELAADEAAERASADKRALACALLAFEEHPHPSVVGIAPERVDRLLGRHQTWEMPLLLLVGASVTLVAFGALTIRLLAATDQASISLPLFAAQACMLIMVTAPVLLGAFGLLGTRRLLYRHSPLF